MRAFFLGVKLQIIAAENKRTKHYNLRIQLSPTLFLECGELIDEDDELTPEGICNQVSLDLYSKSSDFFGSPQDGITVWRVRVAQELFGELKPAPEVFWPPEAEMAARRAMMREALSAMTLAVANANPALATSPLRASAPLLMDAPTNLARVRRESFVSGIAASLIIGVTGLGLGYAFWGTISASPRTPTISAPTASTEFSPEKTPASVVPLGHALGLAALTPVTPVRFGDASEASEQLPRATLPSRRDASRGRRDEAHAFAGFRGGARDAGVNLRRRSQAEETKRNSSKEEMRRDQNRFVARSPGQIIGSRRQTKSGQPARRCGARGQLLHRPHRQGLAADPSSTFVPDGRALRARTEEAGTHNMRLSTLDTP